MDNKTLFIFHIFLLISVNVDSSTASTKYVTQTVYGFLDFITTIGNTVMIFSPESAPAFDLTENKIEPVKVIETKPIKNHVKDADPAISPTKLIVINSSKSQNKNVAQHKKTNTQTSSEAVISVQPSEHKNKEFKNSQVYIESNVDKPEYDLLSRQPTEYIEETFKLVNINPNSRIHNKFRNTNHATKICDEKANDKSVSGTCISSKYAQVLNSASHGQKNIKPKLSVSSTPRILKTAAPSIPKINKEEIPISSSFSPNRKPGLTKRFRARSSSSATESTSTPQKTTERTSSQGKPKKSSTRSKSKRRNKHSRHSESEKHSQPTPAVTSTPHEENASRRSFRVKPHASAPEVDTSSSLYMFKLNRTPGRWQYKTTPKPKVNIRKPVSVTSVSSINPDNIAASITNIKNNENGAQNSISNNLSGDLDSSGSQNGAVINHADIQDNQKFFVETLNVEISTPADFKDTYFEIATIKTPYIFQAGVVKKTRFITVTSTFEKVLEPEVSSTAMFDGPLTENILASSSKPDELEGSITTLYPLYLTDSEETPTLETITESFTLTQTKLTTQILPVIRDGDNSTSYMTAVQTYDIKKLITVTKTVLPQDENQFIPSRNLKEFNVNLDTAGSELNFDLDFEDEDKSEYGRDDKLPPERVPNISSMELSTNSASLNQKQLQQLALLNLYQNPTVLNSRPVIKTQTLWKSVVIPIVNGLSTSYRTLSQSVGVIDKTEYELDTIGVSSTVEPQVSQVNPFLLPAPQQFQTITTPLVQQTIVTEISSKILKLTFGAKTAYTTLFSTNVLPKIVTTFVTTSIAVQPTLTFPGYYPPPYPPYPYVG